MTGARSSVRAASVGLVLVVAIALGSPYTRYLLRNTPMTFTALPWGIVGMFAFFVLVVNPLLARMRPSWRLEPPELGVAYSMGIMAAAVVGLGYVGTMLATISAPVYYATPENRWAETFFSYLPKYLVPSDGASAVKWFYDGLPPGELVPWGAWAVSVGWWTSFAGALMALLYGLSVMFRRHWVEHERLPFPLNQVPLAIAEAPERGRFWPPMVRGRVFWWGFSVSCGWLLFNMLGNFLPLFPRIPTELPSVQFGNEFPPIPIKVFFPVIAVSYFAPKEVLLSMWVWMVLGAIYTGVSRRLGLHASLADDSMSWLSTGAMAVFIGIMIWMARRHLATVVQTAIGRGRPGEDADEPISYRMACTLVLGGAAYMLMFLLRAGMDLVGAVMLLGIVMVIYLGLSRLTFEGGILYMSLPIDPAVFTVHALGSANIAPAVLTAVALSYAKFSTMKATDLNAMGHGLALSDRLGYRRSELNWAIPVALAVGIGVAVWYTIGMGYSQGAFNIDNWVFKDAATIPYNDVMRQITDPQSPSYGRLAHFGVGAVLMGVVSFLRYTLPAWPLHPIGLVVCFTYHTVHSSFSVFITWAAKSVIQHVGGIDAYNKCKPFFIGLLLGAVSAASVSFVCDVIWFPRAGHSILYW